MSRWRMRDHTREKTTDRTLGDKVHRATLRTVNHRAELVAERPDWEALRARAREARMRALDDHARLLQSFSERLEARGVHLHLAATAEDAAQLVTRLVMQVGGRVTKGKSMTSEEIALNPALERAGAQVTETDLGELIVQLAGQPPSHITAPAIHLGVEDIARIFRDRMGMEVPAWVDGSEPVEESERKRLAVELSLRARAELRERFCSADVGISGANFLVADSGTVVLVENEGNIQLSTNLPRRHIVLAGIDKLIETDEDLALLLRLLPVSATAQRQTCYVSLFADPHPDMHVVLLDNGRSDLMADAEQRDLLTCIRCGACMNACPVYRNVGGHAYGGAYSGPIGALLLPHLGGGERYRSLPFASSLCGACTEACPVSIPLHHRLLELRARFATAESGAPLRAGLSVGAAVMRSAWAMEATARAYRFAKPLSALAPLGREWSATRELPPAPAQTFRTWWRKHRKTASEVRRGGDEAHTAAGKAGEPRSAPTPGQSPAIESQSPTQSAAVSDLAELFERRLRELGPEGETELHRFGDADSARAFLREQIAECDPSAVLIDGEAADKRDYALGVTRAELIIAETGGLLLDRKSRADNWVSILAETQIAVAHSERVAASLDEAIAARSKERKRGAWHGQQVIVTGPSRTADVEKVLVIPAHGPRRLIVVLCDQDVDLDDLRP